MGLLDLKLYFTVDVNDPEYAEKLNAWLNELKALGISPDGAVKDSRGLWVVTVPENPQKKSNPGPYVITVEKPRIDPGLYVITLDSDDEKTLGEGTLTEFESAWAKVYGGGGGGESGGGTPTMGYGGEEANADKISVSSGDDTKTLPLDGNDSTYWKSLGLESWTTVSAEWRYHFSGPVTITRIEFLPVFETHSYVKTFYIFCDGMEVYSGTHPDDNSLVVANISGHTGNIWTIHIERNYFSSPNNIFTKIGEIRMYT
ncbi:MAG: hypothetical protein JW885_02795 [Deltaproteobacteria bacterium]|nr:hypothetical protein [Candidatus Zymogenaceae bacterium]